MDFAEDRKCSSKDEVKPTYWKFTLVTNHPSNRNFFIILISNKAGDFIVCTYDADKKIYLDKLQEIDYEDDEALTLSLPLTCR